MRRLARVQEVFSPRYELLQSCARANTDAADRISPTTTLLGERSYHALQLAFHISAFSSDDCLITIARVHRHTDVQRI
jgi:hypothetical protein